MERGEVGVALDGGGDAEGGEAAPGSGGLVVAAREGLRGGEVMLVARRVGAEGESGRVGVAGGDEVFALIRGFGGAAEGGVGWDRLGGLSGRRREGEKERRGEQKQTADGGHERKMT